VVRQIALVVQAQGSNPSAHSACLCYFFSPVGLGSNAPGRLSSAALGRASRGEQEWTKKKKTEKPAGIGKMNRKSGH